MKIRTLRRHDNAYGGVYTKNPGRLYEHPAPRVLFLSGLAEDAVKQKASVEPEDGAVVA